jgi:hypothetical protein
MSHANLSITPRPASPSPLVLGTLTADITKRVDHARRKLREIEEWKDLPSVRADLDIAALSCDALLHEAAKLLHQQRQIAQLESINEQLATALERLIAQGFVDRDRNPETHAQLSAVLVLARGGK